MTIAPAIAPASGRASSRASGDLRPTRSSALGGGAPGASAVWVMKTSRSVCRGHPRGAGDPGTAISLAVTLRGVLGDRIDVAGVDEGRAGQHDLAAADGVAVGQVQPQR